MPSNFNHSRRPASAAGTFSVVRYHHVVRASDSGMARLFSPCNGSGYVPSATSDVSTVPGTTAACQPRVSNAGVETISPVPSTCAASCSIQCRSGAGAAKVSGAVVGDEVGEEVGAVVGVVAESAARAEIGNAAAMASSMPPTARPIRFACR